MLRLFVIKDAKTGMHVVRGSDGKPLYFSDKMTAKKARGEGQIVSYGPDHWKTKEGK